MKEKIVSKLARNGTLKKKPKQTVLAVLGGWALLILIVLLSIYITSLVT